MELLERDSPLATLAEARDSAARGAGRVVLVTGEPGIGKTSLVAHFVGGLERKARVLWGTCDDLAIPRPLGPIRDIAGSASAPLEQALAAGAAPTEVQALLVAELERPPRPTVLVREDVHWADDATLDVVTVLARRVARLPAVLVATFRSGEASPGDRLHTVLDAMPADVARFVDDAGADAASRRSRSRPLARGPLVPDRERALAAPARGVRSLARTGWSCTGAPPAASCERRPAVH